MLLAEQGELCTAWIEQLLSLNQPELA